jgi:hypothetical protein
MGKIIIEKILGTCYLCNKFVNHDGTIVSDHPLYVFETNVKDLYACVMFTSSQNPYTTQTSTNKPIGFLGCSDHRGEIVGLRVFQSEVYLFNKNDLLSSEYRFANINYHRRLIEGVCKAIIEAEKTDYKFGLNSVHYADKTQNIDDFKDVLKSLKEFGIKVLQKSYNFPEYGPINTTYKEAKKMFNKSYTKNENQKIFDRRYSRN